MKLFTALLEPFIWVIYLSRIVYLVLEFWFEKRYNSWRGAVSRK